MSAATEFRSFHQMVADSQIGTMPAYIQEQVDQENARHVQAMADWRAMVAATARDPLSGHLIDPSAGDVRRTFYETMRVRGE